MCELENLCEDCAFKSKCKKYKENKLLKNKLEIAIKALKEYADKKTWDCCYRNQCAYVDGYIAQQALKEIEKNEQC